MMKHPWIFAWLVVCSLPASGLFPSLDLRDPLLTWEECGQKALSLDDASFLFRPRMQDTTMSGNIWVHRRLGDKR